LAKVVLCAWHIGHETTVWEKLANAYLQEHSLENVQKDAPDLNS